MNRHELYRPLLERSLENFQVGHLSRCYDFGRQSRVARLLVDEINGRMDQVEEALGIERVRPFELYLKLGRTSLRLPLFRPDYLAPMLGGHSFAEARGRVVETCLGRLQAALGRASRDEVLRLIDPWALVRRKGPGRYVDQLCAERRPYDPASTAEWAAWLDGLRPLDPTSRLQSLDTSAPESVVRELTAFVTTEAGLGRTVARQLVEDVILLRNVSCPRTSQLRSGELPLLSTHVRARLTEETATRFRRLAPVIVTVWTPEELKTQPQAVPQCLEVLKRRLVRVCFEAYRQNGLLSLMELQWVFQLSSARVSELLRSVQREHNLVVPTPGTVLDAGRSITHKDVIVGLHLEGHTVRDIARITHHSPRAVDNYVGTFEAVLVLELFGVPPALMARVLNKGLSLVRQHRQLVQTFHGDLQAIRKHLAEQGVKIESVVS